VGTGLHDVRFAGRLEGRIPACSRAGEAGAGISVLSVRRGLTVWCRADTISWRTRAGVCEQRMLTDLEDAAERIVSLCEELDSGTADGYTGFDRVR
jgi:hypothetical protein